MVIQIELIYEYSYLESSTFKADRIGIIINETSYFLLLDGSGGKMIQSRFQFTKQIRFMVC